MQGFSATECVSVGDSEMDLSMQVEGKKFIGFNPTRDSSKQAFEAAVPIVYEKILWLSNHIWSLVIKQMVSMLA